MVSSNQPVITIRNLEKYYGTKRVLKGINLDVYPGQIIGYIGPNGAGKSTTIKIMLGLVRQFTGEVRIFGESVSSGSVEYKRRIGYVPEAAEVYDNLSGREYLTFIGGLYGISFDEADEKAEKMMELFGLKKVYNSRISSYSKGMKQKLLIISSLIHDPDILFLDEPLSGIDANSVIVIKEILEELKSKGKTIFYSSHIMEVVEKISNRIVLINDGQIVADGSFDKLKEESRESSLEDIFNQLTGFKDHKDIAREFVSIIQGVGTHEGV